MSVAIPVRYKMIHPHTSDIEKSKRCSILTVSSTLTLSRFMDDFWSPRNFSLTGVAPFGHPTGSGFTPGDIPDRPRVLPGVYAFAIGRGITRGAVGRRMEHWGLTC